MRKHPVMFGVFLLVLIVFLFFAVVYGVAIFSGGKSSFSLKDKIGVIMVGGIMKDSSSVVDQLVKYGKNDTIKTP